MVHYQVENWSLAYDNWAYIQDSRRWPKMWEDVATPYRAARAADAARTRLGLAYGAHERQHYDLFLPEGKPKGLVVFVHGGYWLALNAAYWSHLAAGPLAHGFAVAIPSYRLCPEVRIAEITADIGLAITAAAGEVAGPIILSGHSAGGQLVCRMVTATSPLGRHVRDRIVHTVSISGLHDLRPLLNTAMNERLRLDASEAAAESVALLEPVAGTRLTCWVGGAERAEFRRQNALLANIWLGLGASIAAYEEPDRHHFNILDSMADPTSALVRTMLDF